MIVVRNGFPLLRGWHISCHLSGQEKFLFRPFLPRRAMDNLATVMTGENKPVTLPRQSGKIPVKNFNWKEIARPLPCYLVMIISSVFQVILAVLLFPYNLLNPPRFR